MTLKTANLLAFIVMIMMNYLANALPLNGKTTGELSNQLPNLFTPAGLTFSIWGVIYLLLLGFVIQQMGRGQPGLNASIGWLFVASCLLNAGWILAWHYERLPLSMGIMTGLLVVLILINARLSGMPLSLTRAAFGIYLGWICIATIANATALLVSWQWGGWGLSQEFWALLMVVSGAVVSALAMQKLDNPFLGLAVAWALLGIVLKRHQDVMAVAVVAGLAMVLVLGLSAWGIYRKLAW